MRSWGRVRSRSLKSLDREHPGTDWRWRRSRSHHRANLGGGGMVGWGKAMAQRSVDQRPSNDTRFAVYGVGGDVQYGVLVVSCK